MVQLVDKLLWFISFISFTLFTWFTILTSFTHVKAYPLSETSLFPCIMVIGQHACNHPNIDAPKHCHNMLLLEV